MQLSNKASIKQIKVNGIDYGVNGECYMSNESGWSTSTYVPAHGEIVIYRELTAPFNTRFKVGDGSTTVGSLDFVEMGSTTDLTGYLKSDYTTLTDSQSGSSGFAYNHTTLSNNNAASLVLTDGQQSSPDSIELKLGNSSVLTSGGNGSPGSTTLTGGQNSSISLEQDPLGTTGVVNIRSGKLKHNNKNIATEDYVNNAISEGVDLTGYLKSDYLTVFEPSNGVSRLGLKGTTTGGLTMATTDISLASLGGGSLSLGNTYSSWDGPCIVIGKGFTPAMDVPYAIKLYNSQQSHDILTSATGAYNIVLGTSAKGGNIVLDGTSAKLAAPSNYITASTSGVVVSATNGISLGSPDGTITFGGNAITVGGTLINSFAKSNPNYAPTTYEYVTKKYVDDKVASGGGSGVPGRFHKNGLVDEQIEWTSDYSAAHISGLVPDCSFVRLGSSVISLTINDMARDLTSDNTYSADAKICFQVASQASLDANGGKFTLTLPDTFILLNEVEFVPGTRYLLEIQGLDYNLDYACRITPIKSWGATTVGGQTFNYDKDEQCVEMTPVQGGN